MDQYKETIEQYDQRINNMFNMLALLPQVRLPPDFPLWTITNPILPHNEILPRANKAQETKDHPN